MHKFLHFHFGTFLHFYCTIYTSEISFSDYLDYWMKEWENIILRFPEGHSCHIPLMLGYHCGLRLGEAFALTWDDINFDNNTISINKQVQMINGHLLIQNTIALE